MRSMRLLAALAVLALTAGFTRHASAATAPSGAGGTVSVVTGSPNTYSLTITDSSGSSAPVGSVWEAWIPGQFYMNAAPTNVIDPAGWTDNITPGGGGWGIQFIASSSANDVPIGGSLSGFSFQDTEAPSTMFGNSTVVPGIPTLTSVAYDGGIFNEPTGTTFVFAQAAVPEPATLGLLAPAALMMLRRNRKAAK